MKTSAKLPYKIQFQPEYQRKRNTKIDFQQKMGKLPVPPVRPNSVIQSIQQIIDMPGLKQKIREEELQFTPSSIYSQYATPNQIKQGAKKITQLCVGCGQQNKKPVQCQFCAVMYCKNCCWRKRVLPNLSEPKDYRLQCQECHAKFIKLFANQKFYEQSAIYQKIIQSCSGRVKKLEQSLKAKKQKFEGSDKKKKQVKIKQNMLLKQLKDQQKKVQALQLKLQEVVKKKAQQLKIIHEQERQKQLQRKRQQQQTLQTLRKQKQQQKQHQKQKQKQQENQKQKEEEERIKKEKQIEEARKREKQLEETKRRQQQLKIEQQQIKIKHQLIQRQLKRKQTQELEEKQRELQKEQQKKMKETKLEQQNRINGLSKLRKQLSDIEHVKQADELRSLAMGMLKQPQNLNEKTIKNMPDVLVTTQVVAQKPKQINNDQILFTPVDRFSKINSNTSNQQILKTQIKPLFISDLKQSLQLNKNQAIANQRFNNSNKSQSNQKTQLTQSTEKANEDSANQKHDEQKQNNIFNSLPQLAINVTQMTVNELLGIHINPNMNNKENSARRQSSIRQSYKQQKRFSQSETPKVPIYEEQSSNQLTQQQKYEILRQSNITSSIIHSNHQPEYQHPDPSGGKCNCSLM